MEHLQHEHPLNLIDLHSIYSQYVEEEEEEDDDYGDALTTKQDFRYLCDRCDQEINWYHRYYYKCSQSCDYSIHRFCAKLPATLKHKSHTAHTLILLQRKIGWRCDICLNEHEGEDLRYRCSLCDFDIDIKCAILVKENHVIHHPCHPHPLVSSTSKPILCECDACGKEHKGIFYHCTTCFEFSIHKDCVFLPKKLLIQQTTHDTFSHTHPLTLSYSFPKVEQDAKFNPSCRICDGLFDEENLWIYKCEKCRYYAHVDCATSRREPFMSIFLFAGLNKTSKNFEDADHPNLLHLPFMDQTCSLLKYLLFKEKGRGTYENHEGSLTHISHEHPLTLVHTQCNNVTKLTSSRIGFLSIHDPLKRIELLCNGCLRPITNMPFYKCANEDQRCNFVLHEWCTQLPPEVKNHPGHPDHTLVLLPKSPDKFFGVFTCNVCNLLCNGFVYSCLQCAYYTDVSCGFIPEKITHEAHPDHLFWRVQTRPGIKYCRACLDFFQENEFSFSCRSCDVSLHPDCALLCPRTIRHKCDKHPMYLSYFPIENHKSEYFCEVCEKEFDPEVWFYHCYECVQSMHCACAPLILQCETATYSTYSKNIYDFVNIKFGGIHNTKDQSHTLSFVQGTEDDGQCAKCGIRLQKKMIFKCHKCKYAIDYSCCELNEN